MQLWSSNTNERQGKAADSRCRRGQDLGNTDIWNGDSILPGREHGVECDKVHFLGGFVGLCVALGHGAVSTVGQKAVSEPFAIPRGQQT